MKALKIICISLLFFLGITAVYGGYSLITDPTGASIQLPEQWIQYTIFKNYLIPGLVLLVMNGLMGIIIAISAIRQSKDNALYIHMQGLIVIGWIVIQILVIRQLFWLQFVFLGIGIFLIISGIMLNTDRKR